MRHLGVALLFVAVAVSGCIQVQVGPEASPTSSTSTSTSTTSAPTMTTPPPPPPASGAVEGYVRDDSGAVGGAVVTILGTELSTTSAGDGGYAFRTVEPGTYRLRAEDAAHNRSTERDVTVLEDDTVFVFLTLPEAPEPPAEDEPEVPSGAFSCGAVTVTEPHRTFGRDDAFHGMSWGALKTGYRFAVGLPGAPEASITYWINGGAPTTKTMDRAAPLFVEDVMAPGSTDGDDVLCFEVTVAGQKSNMHAMALGNGPTSWDPITQTYAVNIYIYSAEGVDRDILEAGIDVYAETMWDASDGLMTAGAAFVHYGAAVDAAGTFEPCNTPFVSIGGILFGLETVLCKNQFDIVFSYNEQPLAAGSTPKWGIEDPFDVIVMNQLWEAGPVFTSDANEIGKVLQHELGHYAMGFNDYYASLAGGPDCYDAQQSISIMGSNRAATEYDDEVHRCPNEDIITADGDVYTPTWQLWQQRYPQVPNRDVIDPGPEGQGGFPGSTIIDWS